MNEPRCHKCNRVTHNEYVLCSGCEQAHKRLYDAAPEMYEFVQFTKRHITASPDNFKIWDEARALIASINERNRP